MNKYLKLLNPTQSIIGMVLCGVLMLVLPFWMQASYGATWVRIMDMALLYIMLSLGLNVVVGMAGLLDLGYVAFYAVGAYVAALFGSTHLTENYAYFAQHFPDGVHFPLWLVLIMGAAAAAIAGIMLGAPILKLRGDYLALVTLGFGEIIRICLTHFDKADSPMGNLTNGGRGIVRLDSVSLFGHDFSQSLMLGGFELTSEILYYFLFLSLTLLSIVVCYRLQNSRLGRAWMALREDEIAAKAMGINIRNIKLLAFSLGATFGGVSGVLFARFQGFISPESFTFLESVMILGMVVLGGMGHIPGVILGAVILTVLPEFLRFQVEPLQRQIFGEILIDTSILRVFILGLAMVLIMLFKPKGLWPTPERANKKVDDETLPLNVQAS